MTDQEREYLAHLRRLTAHLMRVVRGSGDVDDTVRELTATYDALIDLAKATPTGTPLPLDGMRKALELPHETSLDVIVSGALQYAASALTNNNLQKARGSDEMRIGIDLRKPPQNDTDPNSIRSRFFAD